LVSEEISMTQLKIMTTTSVATTTRYELTADDLEKIVAQWLVDRKGIELDAGTEFDWDASSEGLVRGLTITTRSVKEETK